MAGGARGNGASVPGWANGEGAGAGRVPAISAPAFTGRHEELAALGRALAGPPAVVLVEGEAGIGKSRLVREFLTGGRPGAAQPGRGVPLFRRPCTLSPSWALWYRLQPAAARAERRRDLRPVVPEWAD